MTKKLSWLFLSGLTTLIPFKACYAEFGSTQLQVSATVIHNCKISANAVNFGAYDPVGSNAASDLKGSGDVTVACTQGTGQIQVGIDGGNHFTNGTRNLAEGSHNLAYKLYQPTSNDSNAACGEQGKSWGNTLNSDTLQIRGANSIAPRTYHICGDIPAGQEVPDGQYSDTASAVVYFI